LADTQSKSTEFLQTFTEAKSILILTHNNPDPDTLASAFGLRYLLKEKAGIKSVIGYSGSIGRAENKAMVRLLRINPILLHKLKSRKFDALILCDTQPWSKNHDLIPHLQPKAVLDHHLYKKHPRFNGYLDIRPDYGATSTIVTEYLQEAELPIDAYVATALYLGVKTDIGDLARHKNDADLKAARFLFPKISMRWLYRIENPRLPQEYFVVFNEAMKSARVYRNAVITYIR